MVCKAIIFDLDGTLVDTLGDLAGAMNYALEQFGQPVHSVEACRMMIGNGVRKFASLALADDKQDLIDELLYAMKLRYSQRCFVNSCIYDGIKSLVDNLGKMDYQLAVVTNKQQGDARVIVEHFFPGQFEQIIGVTGPTAIKPDPAVTLQTLEQMAVLPGECLFVGDSDVDIATAKAAVITAVGVTWGFRDRKTLTDAGADIIVDTPAEILNLIA